jgi:hypothetical protein
MSKSKPITLGAAIFYGGLIAGILDAADGVVAYYITNQSSFSSQAA